MNEEVMSLKLTLVHRVSVLLLMIAQTLVFVIGEGLFFHYLGFPVPGVSYPTLFTAGESETHYIYNVCLYLLFLVQHILMATLKYKTYWYSKSEYFALYDRYLYNLLSGLILWFIFANVKPSYHHLFTLPQLVCYPLKLIGFGLFVITSLDITASTLIPHKLSTILKDQEITILPYTTKQTSIIMTSGVYGLVRHPMQSGLILIMLFINNVYTTERVIFLVIMISFVVFGVLKEE